MTEPQLTQEITAASPVEDGPVLRTFGNPNQNSKAAKSVKLTKQMVVVGSLVIGGVCTALAWSYIGAPNAPEYTPGGSEARAAPEEGAEPVMPLATPVLASVETPASVPDVAPEVAPVQVDVASLDVNALPEPKTLEEAQTQIRQMKEKLTLVGSDLTQAQQRVADMEAQAEKEAELKKVKASQNPKAVSRRVEKVVTEADYVALSVLDINDERVLVVAANQPNAKVAVTPGAQLPGGAIFIGFDTKSRMMKTDQGEFLIP